MSVKNFKFVSPGVFINEIDNSFIPKTADVIGPVVIGRSRKGLAMQPVKVESYSEFVTMFGDTVPGNGGGDISRGENLQSPMYGTYAAKAFLRANVAPLTYIRLLGQETAAGASAAGDASAGWKTTQNIGTDAETVGGAYGLWVMKSGTVADFSNGGTDTGAHLAAVFYMDSGSISLRGKARSISGGSAPFNSTASTNAPATIEGQGIIIGTDSSDLFTLVVTGANKGARLIEFNFDDSSDKFIRKAVNTNPQLLGTAGTFYANASAEDLWLGETFENSLRSGSLIGTSNGLQGVILGIALSGTVATGPHNMLGQASAEAKAGWFIGQDLGSPGDYIPQTQQKLFRLIGRGHGSWLSKNAKVSIAKVKQSSTTTSGYGTFSVVIRDLFDTDNNVVVLERFDNLTLDPTSPDYVARRIGDQYYTWDVTQRRLKQYGGYPNQSKYVYVDMNADVDAGASDETLLPFGYFGPPKFTDITQASCSHGYNGLSDVTPFIIGAVGVPGIGSDTRVSGALGATVSADSFVRIRAAMTGAAVGGIVATHATASLYFPKDRLRVSASAGGLSDPSNAYFGLSSTRDTTSTRPDDSLADSHGLLYSSFPDDPTGTGGSLAGLNSVAGVDSWSYVFSLDDVRKAGSTPSYFWESGSRASSLSVTSGSYTNVLSDGYGQFTAPFWGGSDGFNIRKPDPLYNKGMGSAVTEDTSYAYHTYRRAIDTVADPEFIDMNLLAVPGLTNDALTSHMVSTCEDRGDAMALIDLANVYIPPHEQYYSSKASRIGTNPQAAATALKDRALDSSYGATFYPWVQTRDDQTGQLLWIPPSVAMMGVLASSERKSQLWFAPAGFNRGGLSDGAAGLPVHNVTERLTSKERDTLYEARINPIASFPSTGIVVFGQKTLQERRSALDRINVRRLVIYLKKQISILSTQILFEQNVQATWLRFKSLVEPLLASTKINFGITDYRLILDSSTTTPDLVDQNILYAKIMIKPARAIEFIAIDFVVMSTGASFDD